MKAENNNGTYILCFAIDTYDRYNLLNVLTEQELYDTAMDGFQTCIYRDVEDFLEDLNSQHISADKYWFYQYRVPSETDQSQKFHVSFGYVTPTTGRQLYRVVTDSAEERDELAMDIVSLHGTSYVKKGDGPGRKDYRILDLTVEDYHKMFCN